MSLVGLTMADKKMDSPQKSPVACFYHESIGNSDRTKDKRRSFNRTEDRTDDFFDKVRHERNIVNNIINSVSSNVKELQLEISETVNKLDHLHDNSGSMKDGCMIFEDHNSLSPMKIKEKEIQRRCETTTSCPKQVNRYGRKLTKKDSFETKSDEVVQLRAICKGLDKQCLGDSASKDLLSIDQELAKVGLAWDSSRTQIVSCKKVRKFEYYMFWY